MSEREWTAPQKSAIEADGCSLSVSAAAGSGKTAVLTQRIIDRIRSGKADISRMLIVTFTRAAAAELSSRISDLLSDECAKNPSDLHIARQSLLLPSAKISTIDGFCLDMIRENFPDTGVSGCAVIDADTESIIENEVMDALISDYFDGNIQESARIENFGNFADTFGSPSSDDALKETAVKLYGFYESVPDRKKAMIGEKNAGFESSVWKKAIYKYSAELFEHYEKVFALAVSLSESDEGLAGRTESYLLDGRYCSLMLGKLRGGAPYNEILSLLSEFSSYRVKRAGTVKAEFKTPELERFDRCRTRFKADTENLRSSFFLCAEPELDRAEKLTHDMQEKLEIFLSEFDARLSAEKKRRRVIGFNDIERIALSLLYDRENRCASEAAKEISKRYDEIYIDEYQDTNEMQDLIFSLISRGDNVFTVGDVKQSIYEFRGAVPSIFTSQIDSREKYGANKNQKAAKIFLSENFRSSCGIIEAVNAVFGKLMNTGGVTHYGEDERLKAGRKDFSGEKPELDIICRDDEKGVCEEKYVAARISGLISSENIKPEAIAVLLPTRARAQAMENALSSLGILCKNTTSSEFFSNPEVLLALSLLNTVDNPCRDVYLAGALVSPVYGVTLGELIHIRKYKKTGSLFSALRAFTDDTGFAKGKKFISDHNKFRKYAGISTCGGLLRKLYDETHIMSLCVSGSDAGKLESARANLTRLYDYARSFEKGGSRGLYEFISFVNGLVERGSATDTAKYLSGEGAVTVTTVHKSKGLEYDVCFLCDMSREFNQRDLSGNVIAGRALPLAMKLFEDDARIDTPMRAAAVAEEKDRKSDEYLRELYVAMTRAKRRLIITGEVKTEEEAESYDFRLDGGKCAFEAKLFSRFSKRSKQCFLDMITLALSENPQVCEFGIVTENPTGFANERKNPEQTGEMTYYEAKTLAQKRFDFVYPFEALCHVPSKLSVSRLYPDVLDPASEGTVKTGIEEESFAKPAFISGEAESGSAERGTAMHMFMQFFDFASVEKLGIAGEVQRLTDAGFIFPSDAAILDIDKLGRFFSSQLAADMKNAAMIYREKRFIINYPAERFSGDPEMKKSLAGETLLVQGVLDCAFVGSDGKLILADYKTDAFPDGTDRKYIENILKKRHARQLGYYRYACEQLFSLPVAHTYIYSFALDGTVEL